MSNKVNGIARAVGFHLRRQAVAYVALAVALGGSAYAGGKAGSDSVGARDLKPLKVRFGDQVTVPPGSEASSTARCKQGEAGLVWLPSSGSNGAFVRSVGSLSRKPKGYTLTARNDTAQAQTLTSGVLCLPR